MNNFDCTQHSKGCSCETCTAFGKVPNKMPEHMATGEDRKSRLVAFHFTSWLNGAMNGDNLT